MTQDFFTHLHRAGSPQIETVVAPTKPRTIYSLLDENARNWWYHRQLRDQGKAYEARIRERASILSNLAMWRTAKLLVLTPGRSTVHYGEPSRSGTCSGYEPDMNLEIARRLGVLAVDLREMSYEAVVRSISIPMPCGARDPDPDERWGSCSYISNEKYAHFMRGLGATVYGLPPTNALVVCGHHGVVSMSHHLDISTLDELLVEVKKLTDAGEPWRVTADGTIRTTFSDPTGIPHTNTCPFLRVYNIAGSCDLELPPKQGCAIPEEDLDDFIAAADIDYDCGNDEPRSDQRLELRKKLLIACDLHEELLS